MKFYIDGKKVSRKSLLEAVGHDRLGFIEREAKMAHADDPLECIEFMIHYQRKTTRLEVRFDV